MCDRPTHQDPPGLWWILALLSGGSHLLLFLLLPVATVRLAMPAGGGMPDWLPVTLQETAVPTPPQLATIPVEPTPELEPNAPPSAPMAVGELRAIAPPQPNPTAQPRPNPSPSPQPRPNPSPSPSPQPRPNPSPSPSPQPRPNPSPQASPNPSPQPSPNPNPQASPNPQPNPDPQLPNPPAPQEFVAILANPTIPSFTNAYGQTVQRDIPDQLATVRTAQKSLAIAQYLIPLGVSLEEQTILEAVVIIDATGKAEVLAEQTRVLAGPLTPAQAGQLAKRIIETWEFNPTIDGGQPKDFDYTLRLTLQALS